MNSSEKSSTILEEISLLLEKKLEEKLEPLVTSINSVCDQINIMDRRLSILEGSPHQEISTVTVSDSQDLRATPQVNFDNKDEMLKRAYDVLAEAPRPLTTQEVADRIGRSRSTTSQYLNELHQRNLLLKTYGTTPDKSRNVVFRPANQS
ncbi:MAG: helix-turn-helix domain-containing protein [Candidatus Hodarchaeales archaeon]